MVGYEVELKDNISCQQVRDLKLVLLLKVRKNQILVKLLKATIDGMRRHSAISQALASAKARNAKAVRALLDESKLVLNEDGTLSGLKEQLEAVQKDNGYLFEESDHGEGGKPFFGGNGSKGGSSGDALKDAMFSAAGLSSPKS